MTTYYIDLWDHEIEPDGGWSEELAAEHLDSPAHGLSILDVRRALRKLLPEWGWCSLALELE